MPGIEAFRQPLSESPLVRPVVLVTSCRRDLDGFSCHTVRGTYIEALEVAGCQPLVVPRVPDGGLEALLELADGVLFTGSPSNVHASHYDEEVRDPSLPQDRERDAWTLPAIREVVARGIPLLGICRGFQEFNVAFGGSLHQAVHEVPGLMDHRPAESLDQAGRYAPAHVVELMEGGILAGLMGTTEIEVNSVHGQGVNRTAEGLQVEAIAPDGLVEALSCPEGRGFNLAVQWHPEWRVQDQPRSLAIFRAFGRACMAYRQSRAESAGGLGAPA